MEGSIRVGVHLSLFVLAGFLCAPVESAGAPAMFILGDSLIDNGNNNFLPSVAKANFAPYGIDFGSPTGRFCNGLTVTDFGARFLGLPFPPPFLSLDSGTPKILTGVNYASAAAGILDDTGRHYGSRVTFNGQIALLEKTIKTQLPLLIPNPDALSLHLAASVFVVNIGSNDYINNYLLPNLYTTSKVYSGDAFADILISTLTQKLKSLYQLGARKMILVGMGPLGCIPSQMFQAGSTGGCVGRVNKLVSAFNKRLVALTTSINSTLPGSFFVYEHIYDTFYDMIQNPSRYGFTVVNQACCGNGRFGGAWSCIPLQPPCRARDQYIFWDSFHPTQAANAIIAERCYSASGTDCYPISGYQLAQI